MPLSISFEGRKLIIKFMMVSVNRLALSYRHSHHRHMAWDNTGTMAIRGLIGIKMVRTRDGIMHQLNPLPAHRSLIEQEAEARKSVSTIVELNESF